MASPSICPEFFTSAKRASRNAARWWLRGGVGFAGADLDGFHVAAGTSTAAGGMLGLRGACGDAPSTFARVSATPCSPCSTMAPTCRSA